MTAWQGDWNARILARISDLGFASAREFAATLPMASTAELAAALGNDVAAVQLERVLYLEAEHDGVIEEYARSMLARVLRDWLLAGWASGDQSRSTLAGAWAEWKSMLPDDLAAAAMGVWERLKCQEAPMGWLPEGPDDPIIERAFAGVRFDAPDADG